MNDRAVDKVFVPLAGLTTIMGVIAIKAYYLRDTPKESGIIAVTALTPLVMIVFVAGLFSRRLPRPAINGGKSVSLVLASALLFAGCALIPTPSSSVTGEWYGSFTAFHVNNTLRASDRVALYLKLQGNSNGSVTGTEEYCGMTYHGSGLANLTGTVNGSTITLTSQDAAVGSTTDSGSYTAQKMTLTVQTSSDTADTFSVIDLQRGSFDNYRALCY